MTTPTLVHSLPIIQPLFGLNSTIHGVVIASGISTSDPVQSLPMYSVETKLDRNVIQFSLLSISHFLNESFHYLNRKQIFTLSTFSPLSSFFKL